MRDAFSGYHPLVNFLFFAAVLLFSMCCMQPVCLLISLVLAAYYNFRLKGRRAVRFSLKFMLPMLLAAALINPAFNHEGMTILAYLPNGNPLTKESIAYGLAAAIMLAAVFLWFSCFNEVITSDKFVWIFGRIVPALSLLLSMTLRFIPRFKAQLDTVRNTQMALGRDTVNGTLLKRIRSAIACFSITVTWSMESAIDTADSMRSRGYGTGKRTAYSVYRFQERDRMALIFLAFCVLALLGCAVAGAFQWRYYPTMRGNLAEPMTVFAEIIFLCLCAMPIFLDRREEFAWNSLQSTI